MITFKRENVRFSYRVVGIAINDNRVLLHKSEDSDFWSLPGGRGELLEASKDTLKREMHEELNTNADIGRLVWIIENFYEEYGDFNHELGLYFLMEFPSNSIIYQKTDPFIGYEGNMRLIFKWHSIDRIEDLILYPTFLKKSLKSMPNKIEHVVQKGGDLYERV